MFLLLFYQLEKAQKASAMKQTFNETLSQHVQALLEERDQFLAQVEKEKQLREKAEAELAGLENKPEEETNIQGNAEGSNPEETPDLEVFT